MALARTHQQLEDYQDYVRPSRYYYGGGRWSGCEGRYRKRFIAMIPLSRYVEKEDKEPVNYYQHSTFVPKEKHESINTTRTGHSSIGRMRLPTVQRTNDIDVYESAVSPWSGMCSLVRFNRPSTPH